MPPRPTLNLLFLLAIAVAAAIGLLTLHSSPAHPGASQLMPPTLPTPAKRPAEQEAGRRGSEGVQ